MAQTKKLYSIEAMRFFCMLVICFWHCFRDNQLLSHGNVAVEWFFILSGMLLYGSYTRHKDEGTLDYTFRKFTRFSPEYLLVLVYILLRHFILPAVVGKRPLDADTLLNAIPEALMIQDCGFYAGGVNHPLWYVCSLLLGGGIIHSLLRNYREKALSLFLPVIVLLGYTYMFQELERGTMLNIAVKGCIKISLLRGVCGIGLGVIVAHLMSRKQELLQRRHRLFDVLSVLGFAMFFLLFFAGSRFHQLSLIASSFMLVGCLTKDSTLNKVFSWNIWGVLGALSWEMLIIHAQFSIPIYENIAQKFPLSAPLSYVVYFVIVMASAFALKYVYAFMKKRKWIW